ncbi:MAG: S8 family serine peptidase [Candidatus Kapabacteria bacterium]|nr:S8 family serine peptidase [Candidatus Kapabacteria bacterium]
MRLQTYERASVWLITLIVALAMTINASAQRITCRVSFTDKGPTAFLPNTAVYDSVLRTFHPRALERRARMGMDPVLDSLDAPIYAPYLDSIRMVSDSIVVIAPWFNYVVVGLTESDQQRTRTLSFVRSVIPTSSIGYKLEATIDCDPPRYGHASLQQDILNATELHHAGIYGTGVRIGVIDNGFRWRDMSSLQHLTVAAEYDAIFNDSNTANEGIDVGSQDKHGSLVLSVLAAWQQDSLIGVAPFGTYLLTKSEDMRYERRIEEDFYVASLTWLEMQGADISSSSVGYLTFDSTDQQTPYLVLDGHTSYASRAINIAASRGMTCITAAGNEGPRGQSLITPADADSSVTVGALAIDGTTFWPFSSWGPTADGRIKPDFSALGMSVAIQTVEGEFRRSSGTSLSAPQVAGQVALLRELYPTETPWEIRKALRQASMFPDTPDSVLGHGAANVTLAAKLLGPGVGPPTVVTVDSKRAVFTSVFSNVTVEVKLVLRDPLSNARSEITAQQLQDPWYLFSIEPQFITSDTMFARVVATQPGSARVGTYPRDTSWFLLPRHEFVKPCGVQLPGGITRVNKDVAETLEPSIYNHPLAIGAQHIIVGGIHDYIQSVQLFQIATGTILKSSFSNHDLQQLIVDVPTALSSGAYLLVLRSAHSTTSLPVIVR